MLVARATWLMVLRPSHPIKINLIHTYTHTHIHPYMHTSLIPLSCHQSPQPDAFVYAANSGNVVVTWRLRFSFNGRRRWFSEKDRIWGPYTRVYLGLTARWFYGASVRLLYRYRRHRHNPLPYIHSTLIQKTLMHIFYFY